MNKVVYLNTGYADTLIEQPIFEQYGYEIHEVYVKNVDEIPVSVRDAEILVVTLFPVNQEVISYFPHLKVIGRMGVGTDSIDLEYAGSQQIAVINIPDYCVEEVALQAASLLLACHRKLLTSNQLVKENRWNDSNDLKPIRAMSELTLGLIGMGRIGAKFIEMLKPFVKKIIVADPFLMQAQVAEDIELVSLDQIWERSNFISLHCPLNNTTRELLNKDTFALMQQQPIIINVSRGAIINENDLLVALDEGMVRSAGLDVLNQEPPVSNNPLISHPNVIITNHLAWYSVEAEFRLRALTAERVMTYIHGGKVETIANRKFLVERDLNNV